MALRNDSNKPKFEAQDDSNTGADVAQAASPLDKIVEEAYKLGDEIKAENAAAASDAPTVDTPTPAAPQTSVAPRAGSALSTSSGAKRQMALSEFQNVFEMEQFEFNTFPRLVVGLDGFTNKEGEIGLGNQIKIKLMSWSPTWTASPGTDDDEAKKQVRYSIDGKTIKGSDEDGQDLHAYCQRLKEVEGYEKAAVKEYLVIIGFLTYANGKEIDEADQYLVSLQVPPVSKPFFTRYQMEATVKIASGVWQPTDLLTCTQEKQVNGSKKFAQIKFSRG